MKQQQLYKLNVGGGLAFYFLIARYAVVIVHCKLDDKVSEPLTSDLAFIYFECNCQAGSQTSRLLRLGYFGHTLYIDLKPLLERFV